MQLETLSLWLFTYLLHSSLLLGGALVLRRIWPAAVEQVWRTALFGALLTTSLHVATGFQPISGHLPLVAAATPATNATAERAAGSPAHHAAIGLRSPVSDGPATPLVATSSPLPEASASSRSLRPRGLSSRRTPALLWALVATALLLSLAVRHRSFLRRVSRRETLADSNIQGLLERLRERAGFRRQIRLTQCAGINVPHARGWRRPEICLPERLCREMQSDEIEAVLAHELAHLERRDPVWRMASRLVAELLFLQPLNRHACNELAEQAELACDARATALTGRPLALARCLTSVASWGLDPSPGLGVPALAAHRGNLRLRVRRLVQGEASHRRPWWGQLAALMPVALVLTLTPSLAAPPPSDDGGTRESSTLLATFATDTTKRGDEAAALVLPVPRFANELVALAAGSPTPQAGEARATGEAEPTVPATPTPPSAGLEPATPATPRPAARPVPAPLVAATPAPPAPVAEPAPAPAPAPQPPTEPQAPDQVKVDAERELDELEEAELEALEEEIEEAMESIEDEIEEAFGGLEQVIDEQMEVVEETLEGRMELLEEEIEESMEAFEVEIEALAEEHETTEDEQRRLELEARMGELGGMMGELGGEIGRLASAMVNSELQEKIQSIVAVHVEQAHSLAEKQARMAELVARHVEASVARGERPTAEEMQQLRAEVQSMAAELRPDREEIERLAAELRRELEPTREEIERLNVEMEASLEEWRARHAETLRELAQKQERAERERDRALEQP
jgi:hypothetical protein